MNEILIGKVIFNC